MEDTNRDVHESREPAVYPSPTSNRNDIGHERRDSQGWNRWMSMPKSWFASNFNYFNFKTTVDNDRTFPNHVGAQDERLFRDKLDHYSETDIIRECEKLNYAIRATSLTLVDEWSRSRREHDYLAQTSTSTDDQGDLHHILGASLLRLITAPSLELERWMPYALQAIAVEMCFEIVSRTFCPNFSPTTNHEMQKVFDDMISHESQQKALHWRALTYGYSRRINDIETVIAERIKTMEHYFFSTFILAGEEPTSAFTSRIHEVITEQQIVEFAVTLSKVLKTGLLSVHLDVYRVAPDLIDLRQELREGSTSAEEATHCAPDQVPPPSPAHASHPPKDDSAGNLHNSLGASPALSASTSSAPHDSSKLSASSKDLRKTKGKQKLTPEQKQNLEVLDDERRKSTEACVLCTTQLGIREIIPNNVRTIQERILLEAKVIFEASSFFFPCPTRTQIAFVVNAVSNDPQWTVGFDLGLRSYPYHLCTLM